MLSFHSRDFQFTNMYIFTTIGSGNTLGRPVPTHKNCIFLYISYKQSKGNFPENVLGKYYITRTTLVNKYFVMNMLYCHHFTYDFPINFNHFLFLVPLKLSS